MVADDVFAAQKSLLSKIHLKGYKDFQNCRKSFYKRPTLVILNSGKYYIDGLTTCKKDYCSECVKAKLFKAGKEIAKVNEFIQQENLRPTMLTLTIPHKLSDNLKHLKLIMDSAVRGLLAESKNKLTKKINQSVGNVGYILRNEITYNDINGWNPHCHILNLQSLDYSENQKNQLVDNFAHQLEVAGFHFSRLDKYNIERKGGLIHFNENFTNVGYLTKFDSDNPVNLACTNPEKYVEFAQSFNISQKIPLVKFKNGLKSKINKTLYISEENNQKDEVKRIEIPDFLLHQHLSADRIGEFLLKEKSLIYQTFCS